MGKTLGAALGGMLIACSSPAEPDEESLECSPDDRRGTYLVTSEELGGTCGELPPFVGRLDDTLPDGCSLDEPDSVSADGCTLERSLTCVDASGQTTYTVGTTTQETDSGSVLTGVATITLRDAAGSELCTSTYRLRYERQ